MQRYGLVGVAVWPAVAAALAFITLLVALFALADSNAGHRYAELPDPAMRVGLPPGYDYCEASPQSPRYYCLICDRRREAEFSASFAARYYVWVFDAEASSRLGYDLARGIDAARGAISAAFFTRLALDGIGRRIDPSLDVRPLDVDGHKALEFTTTGTAPVGGVKQQQHLIIIDLNDGRLISISNHQYSPISPEADASNFRAIVRGIKFHPS